jgi:hypothetical protein
MTLLAIAGKLGGADRPECIKQAERYATMCGVVGGQYKTYNRWLGCDMYPCNILLCVADNSRIA